MKLTAREDIDRPVAEVFARLADFERWERAALRRGAEVQRLDTLARVGRGLTWGIGFSYRGKPRNLTLRLDEMVPSSRLGFSGKGANLEGVLAVDLIEMSPQRTRVQVKLDLRPRTLLARLFIQSMRLNRGRIEGKFRARVAQIASEL